MSTLKSALPSLAAWTVGLACFAAFLSTYSTPHPTARFDVSALSSAPLAPSPTPPLEASVNVIELAPIVIVGHVPTTMLPNAQEKTSRERVCGEWRPLMQGDESQRVRLCE